MAGPRLPCRRLRRPRGRVPVDEEFPGAKVIANGLHGAKLYRRNIPPRIMRPAALPRARVPVQLIVPSGDRFISTSYYDAAGALSRLFPGLARRLAAYDALPV